MGNTQNLQKLSKVLLVSLVLGLTACGKKEKDAPQDPAGDPGDPGALAVTVSASADVDLAPDGTMITVAAGDNLVSKVEMVGESECKIEIPEGELSVSPVDTEDDSRVVKLMLGDTEFLTMKAEDVAGDGLEGKWSAAQDLEAISISDSIAIAAPADDEEAKASLSIERTCAPKVESAEEAAEE